jgi:putative ABC transport system ATP-binding protein
MWGWLTRRTRPVVSCALVSEPSIVLADEPTGNLDRRNGEVVMETFDRAAERGAAVVVITHDMELASTFGRVVRLDDGQIASA